MHAFLLHGGDAPWESLIFMAVVAVLGIAGFITLTVLVTNRLTRRERSDMNNQAEEIIKRKRLIEEGSDKLVAAL